MDTIKSLHSNRTAIIILVMLMIPAGLYLDSITISSMSSWGQTAANIIMIISYLIIYRTAPRKLQKIMFYGLFIALAGEVLFSLVLGMYEYRLENIPIYVPPGHAIIYASVYYFIRLPGVIRHQSAIEKLLLAFAIAYGIFWLSYDNDVYGFICLIALLVIYKYYTTSRLFLLSMYAVVAYLEQIGTLYGCWYWPEIAFNSWAWLPSGNPPSAISVFYFTFDIACVKVYLRMHGATRLRFKSYRAMLQSS